MISAFFAISSPNPVLPNELPQDISSIDFSDETVPNFDQFPHDVSSIGISNNPVPIFGQTTSSDGGSDIDTSASDITASDLTDSTNSGGDELTSDDAIAECDINRPSSGKGLRRETLCLPRVDEQRGSPIPEDNGSDSQGNNDNRNKCPPDIYGPNAIPMCDSINRAADVKRAPGSLNWLLYNAAICRFQCSSAL